MTRRERHEHKKRKIPIAAKTKEALELARCGFDVAMPCTEQERRDCVAAFQHVKLDGVRMRSRINLYENGVARVMFEQVTRWDR